MHLVGCQASPAQAGWLGLLEVAVVNSAVAAALDWSFAFVQASIPADC